MTVDPFAALDTAIRDATPETRPGLVVGLAARIALLGASLTTPAGTPVAKAAEPGRLLTYQEAAGLLRCSASYVETLVRQGKLPAVRLPATDQAGRHRDGRMVRLHHSDVLAWAEAHRA